MDVKIMTFIKVRDLTLKIIITNLQHRFVIQFSLCVNQEGASKKHKIDTFRLTTY